MGFSCPVRLALYALLLGGLFGCSKPSRQSHDFFHRLSKPADKDLYLVGVIQEMDHTPIYAVCLLSADSRVTFSQRSAQITAIEGHPIAPPLHKKAIYTLNSDSTLREIPLSEQQVDAYLNGFGRIASVQGQVDLEPLRDKLSFAPGSQ